MTQHPLADALRAIAEGNLGDMPWQANYERIRKVAAEALSQYEKSDTDRDKLREALTAEEQRAVSEELETLAKRWECSGRYSSNRVSAFYRAALASKTAIDPVTVEACAKIADEEAEAVEDADNEAGDYWIALTIARRIRSLGSQS